MSAAELKRSKPQPETYEEFDDRTPPEREAAAAAVAKALYRTPDLALVPCQQAICLRCDQTISPHLVEDAPCPPRGDRMIRAYCDHCDVLYERRVRISAGVAIGVSDTRLIADLAEKGKFLARLRVMLHRYAKVRAC